ncbi:MAG: peptidase [Pseudohongiellaceae bacterium]
MKRIEIFKPGSHTAMTGETIGFTEAQLRESAKAYDPALHEAPIVVGHPSHDHPAYGWIRSLDYADSLQAEPDQVEPQFAEMVGSGRFKKVSASFYRPDSPANPVPGVYYLRHVGFLGAQPPAIKGLKQVEFSEAGDDVVELNFGEVRAGSLMRLFRSMREWLISDKGMETADKILPDWEIDHLEADDHSPAYSEPAARPSNQPHQPTQEVTDVDKQELERKSADIQAREDRIKQQEANFAEREQKLRNQANTELVNDLVKEGRVLPKHRDGLVAFMANLESDQVVEFGEGDGKVKTTPAEFLESFLKELPVSVDYSERSAGDGHPEPDVYQTPQGYSVHPDKARVHSQALAYQERNSCDYLTAVRAIERGGNA